MCYLVVCYLVVQHQTEVVASCQFRLRVDRGALLLWFWNGNRNAGHE